MINNSSMSSAVPEEEPCPATPQANRKHARVRRYPELEVGFGARIRAARISAGLSQTALGAAVGISFQQVQKYEKGADRIAASTLQGFATALGVHPGSFFDDVPLPVGSIAELKTARKLAETPPQIRDAGVRRCLLSLAKVLGEEEPCIEPKAQAEQPSSDSENGVH